MEETKFPTMRRPRRKLCYLTGKESAPKQWGTVVTLEDVDKMFDDLDSPPHEDVQTFEYGLQLNEKEVSPIPKEGGLMVNEVDALYPAIRSSSPKPDVEKSLVVKHSENQCDTKTRAASPFFLLLEDKVKAKPSSTLPATQKSLHVEEATEEIASCEPVESVPSGTAFTKKSSQKQKPEEPRRKERAEVPVVAVTLEPELENGEKKSKSVPRPPPAETFTRTGHDMNAFLQKLKLKEAGQSKAPSSCQSVLPVQIPVPPEPEDEDFLILEDDATFHFSIPTKNSLSKRRKQSRTSSSDKDNSTEKGPAQENSSETPHNQKEPEKGKLESQPTNQKTKKKKGTEKKNKGTSSETDERLPTNVEKPNRKKQQQQAGQPKARARGERINSEMEEEIPGQKMDLKMHKPFKSNKSSKEKREKNTTSRTKSSKGDGEGQLEKDAVKETVEVEDVEQPIDPCSHGDIEDVPLPEKEIENSDINPSQNKPSSPSEGAPSEDSPILARRKRNPPSSWWLSSPQETQESVDQQPTIKKSKQTLKETKAAAAGSPARKNKKDEFLKKRGQKVTAVLSSQHLKNVKDKKNKQNKKGKMREDLPVEEKATDEVLDVAKEQQEVPDGGQQHSSPLIFTSRDHSRISGEQIFQKIYHPSHNEKLSTTHAVSKSPGQSKEQQEEAQFVKRRRKPTGNWWMVNNNNMAEDAESSSTQLLQSRMSKHHKERRKPLKPSKSPLPSSDENADASPIPPGGAPAPPLKIKPLLAPKTAKRSLAKYTDIFTSGINTPRVVSQKDAQQRRKRNAPSRPAEGKAAEDCGMSSQHHTASDEHTANNPETQPEDRFQAESTSNVHRSGPVSMLELDDFDDINLPSSRIQSVLSVSDLCGPPLKPLVLQPKDSNNLALWFKSLWSTVAKNDAEITPDQFDWYFYQDRAMGLQAELNSGCICTGKILLGSHMKKPLWVDHTATTVFHLLTSSVSVTIDGSESRVGPGQSFMVNCGHAYSIKNLTAQPAVLYFTRIVADSLD